MSLFPTTSSSINQSLQNIKQPNRIYFLYFIISVYIITPITRESNHNSLRKQCKRNRPHIKKKKPKRKSQHCRWRSLNTKWKRKTCTECCTKLIFCCFTFFFPSLLFFTCFYFYLYISLIISINVNNKKKIFKSSLLNDETAIRPTCFQLFTRLNSTQRKYISKCKVVQGIPLLYSHTVKILLWI